MTIATTYSRHVSYRSSSVTMQVMKLNWDTKSPLRNLSIFQILFNGKKEATFLMSSNIWMYTRLSRRIFETLIKCFVPILSNCDMDSTFQCNDQVKDIWYTLANNAWIYVLNPEPCCFLVDSSNANFSRSYCNKNIVIILRRHHNILTSHF